jgi:hypothetical protein
LLLQCRVGCGLSYLLKRVWCVVAPDRGLWSGEVMPLTAFRGGFPILVSWDGHTVFRTALELYCGMVCRTTHILRAIFQPLAWIL